MKVNIIIITRELINIFSNVRQTEIHRFDVYLLHNKITEFVILIVDFKQIVPSMYMYNRSLNFE